jgi:hypothetical protein
VLIGWIIYQVEVYKRACLWWKLLCRATENEATRWWRSSDLWNWVSNWGSTVPKSSKSGHWNQGGNKIRLAWRRLARLMNG